MSKILGYVWQWSITVVGSNRCDQEEKVKYLV
jgi:hypothetical protein